MDRKYMPDDKVAYVGSRFAKEIGSAMGWVITEIRNDPGMYVVEFGSDTYLCRSHLLAPFKATPKDEKNAEEVRGIEIRRNRRRTSEDEE